MKKSDRDEDAFEEKLPPRKPPKREEAAEAEERPPRKAPPPVNEGNIEEAQERPRRRPRPLDEEEEERPRRRPRSRDEEEDDADDRSRRRRGRDEQPYSTLIPYRNVMALIGYYLGMGSLIAILGGIALIFYNPVNAPFVGMIVLVVIYGLGGLSALMAIIFGIIGMVYANKNPKARGLGHAITGIVLGILEVLGLLAILVLGVMARQRF